MPHQKFQGRIRILKHNRASNKTMLLHDAPPKKNEDITLDSFPLHRPENRELLREAIQKRGALDARSRRTFFTSKEAIELYKADIQQNCNKFGSMTALQNGKKLGDISDEVYADAIEQTLHSNASLNTIFRFFDLNRTEVISRIKIGLQKGDSIRTQSLHVLMKSVKYRTYVRDHFFASLGKTYDPDQHIITTLGISNNEIKEHLIKVNKLELLVALQESLGYKLNNDLKLRFSEHILKGSHVKGPEGRYPNNLKKMFNLVHLTIEDPNLQRKLWLKGIELSFISMEPQQARTLGADSEAFLTFLRAGDRTAILNSEIKNPQHRGILKRLVESGAPYPNMAEFGKGRLAFQQFGEGDPEYKATYQMAISKGILDRRRIAFDQADTKEGMSKEDYEKIYNDRPSKLIHFPHRVEERSIPVPYLEFGVQAGTPWRFDIHVPLKLKDTIFPWELFSLTDEHRQGLGQGDHGYLGWIGGRLDEEKSILYVLERQADIAQRTRYLRSYEQAVAIARERLSVANSRQDTEAIYQANEALSNLPKILNHNNFFPQYSIYRSKIERYFKYWGKVFFAHALNKAIKEEIKFIYSVTGPVAASTRGGSMRMVFEKVYDDPVQPFITDKVDRFHVVNIEKLTSRLGEALIKN